MSTLMGEVDDLQITFTAHFLPGCKGYREAVALVKSDRIYTMRDVQSILEAP